MLRSADHPVAGHLGTVADNLYQKAVDYPTECANANQVIIDTNGPVTVI